MSSSHYKHRLCKAFNVLPSALYSKAVSDLVQSIPRTRLRLQQQIAAPYNPDPNVDPSTSSDVYRDEYGVTWKDYEVRTRAAHAKAEARKAVAQEGGRKRPALSGPSRSKGKEDERTVSVESTGGSSKQKGKATEIADDKGRDVLMELDVDEMDVDSPDGDVRKGKETGRQKREDESCRKSGGPVSGKAVKRK